MCVQPGDGANMKINFLLHIFFIIIIISFPLLFLRSSRELCSFFLLLNLILTRFFVCRVKIDTKEGAVPCRGWGSQQKNMCMFFYISSLLNDLINCTHRIMWAVYGWAEVVKNEDHFKVELARHLPLSSIDWVETASVLEYRFFVCARDLCVARPQEFCDGLMIAFLVSSYFKSNMQNMKRSSPHHHQPDDVKSS